jgi:hypothetical protein
LTPDRKERPRSGMVPRPGIGQPFNPWHKTCGFYPPDVVGRQRDLTDGQKRLYERGVRWAGQNGTFWYSFNAIAAALGKSVRQVKSDMAALERKGFLAHDRRGKCQSNVYRFLWHPTLDSEVQLTARQTGGIIPLETPCEVQPAASHDKKGEVRDLPSDVQSSVKSEVQPAALEFSPLLNCVQNRVQNQKLITGDESQEPAIRTPGDSALVAGFADKNEKADQLVAHVGQNGKPPSQEVQPEDLMKLRATLIAYMGGIPPGGFENSCLLRAHGAGVAEIIDLINRRWRIKKHRPGARCGPWSWNWFLTVIANEFSPAERGHSPEAVATARAEHLIAAEDLAQGIEALEVSPADSLVCSYRCRCGAEIRQYETRIEGTCNCAPQRKQPATSVGNTGFGRVAVGGAQ